MKKSSSSILTTIRAQPGSISLAELLQLHPDLPKRTVQRWLKSLISDGLITAEGKGPNRRYQSGKRPEIFEDEEKSDHFPKSIPLSVGSRQILSYIDQPLEARKPVGYSRELLDSYQPNQTGYLSESQRRHLHNIGRTDGKNLLAGTYARNIFNRLLIDLSWASSHLEGNTYSRLDTAKLIEQGQLPIGKAAAETQMILNHKSAIELLIENASDTEFNRYTVFNLHSILSENLLPNVADEGRVRQHAVEIGKSVYKPLTIHSQIDELLNLILDKAKNIFDPFEQSFFIMVHLPYLQPFADVNKRTSRLVANIPLIRENLCPLTFLHVTEKAYSRAMLGVYELGRVDLLRDLYIWAYERSTQEYLIIRRDVAEPDPLRLAYRDVIKKTVNQVVTALDREPEQLIYEAMIKHVNKSDQENVKAIIEEELTRLHEGVLVRYGLKISSYRIWKQKQEKESI